MSKVKAKLFEEKRDGVIKSVKNELYPAQDYLSADIKDYLDRFGDLYVLRKKQKSLPQRRTKGNIWGDIPFHEFLGICLLSVGKTVAHWAWIDNRRSRSKFNGELTK